MMFVFFFNDTATTEIYTLSLHDALPIFDDLHRASLEELTREFGIEGLSEDEKDHLNRVWHRLEPWPDAVRSEEHTSELQSRQYLVCRLLLEKKKLLPLPLIHFPTFCFLC